MFARHSAEFAEFLKAERLLPVDELDGILREHEQAGRPLAEIVFAPGRVERHACFERLAACQQLGWVGTFPTSISGEAIAAVPGELARRFDVMPWRLASGSLDLLVADPFALEDRDALGFRLGRSLRFYFADPDRVRAAIEQHYGAVLPGAPSPVAEATLEPANRLLDHELTPRELEALGNGTAVVNFVDHVLARAVREQASDVHFEPFENEFKIRYRVDGALCELTPPAKALALPVVSRLKVLANLNIAERRVPQDGRINLRVGEQPVDLRVSTLPTQFGESVVLRVLDQSALRLDLRDLGMPDLVRAGVENVVRRPNGIFVVTGPTGSGKTTTLYSALQRINTTDLKILTAEDPVEYEIDGLMQMPVNAAIGVTFAAALRSFLRQDPDVIMVGEIRDLETAQIAIQAALTGHLVLATLHTNDAAGAVTRLVDMGVEPFLIASTLEAVLAQRLVRRTCVQCRTEYIPSAELLTELGLRASSPETGATLFSRGLGCDACNGSGYRGRLGLYEWFPVSEAMREMIARCAPTWELRERAVADGMQPLREAGIQAARKGDTTVAEVLRYT